MYTKIHCNFCNTLQIIGIARVRNVVRRDVIPYYVDCLLAAVLMVHCAVNLLCNWRL